MVTCNSSSVRRDQCPHPLDASRPVEPLLLGADVPLGRQLLGRGSLERSQVLKPGPGRRWLRHPWIAVCRERGFVPRANLTLFTDTDTDTDTE